MKPRPLVGGEMPVSSAHCPDILLLICLTLSQTVGVRNSKKEHVIRLISEHDFCVSQAILGLLKLTQPDKVDCRSFHSLV